jgi:hypothetical protein
MEAVMQATQVLIEVARLQPMRRYMVRFRRAGQVVRQFEAIGTDSCSVVMQHADLCEPGEKIDVMGLDEYHAAIDAGMLADKRRDGYGQRNFAAWLAAEQRRADVERVCGGAS